MRKVTYIVVHCTGGRQNQTLQSIQNGWKALGWKNPGYHRLIDADGSVHTLADDEKITNGVAGKNAHAIHICYKGGWDFDAKKGLDNRTEAQKQALLSLLKGYKEKYPQAEIVGHRDLSPDRNGNGIIEKHEWVKLCPSFEAIKEYGYL